MTEPRLRQAARAVVLDPDDRILLVRFEFPKGGVWATPGGGVDEGETHESAIARELEEEVGLTEVELGPWIWTRTHVFPFESGLWDGQQERYVVVRTAAFEPAPRFTVEQLAAEHVTAIRWWTQAELAESRAVFAPRRLPQLVAALLRDGPPPAPIDAGV
ncbi:MAG TPA: NUDIX domain-containing protein [Gaiellaceae bacterium]|nr:NUDIX domain-containing protein [Gaiellaceae bacterium]